jgi:cellulose biosynthesis protein BcsQ
MNLLDEWWQQLVALGGAVGVLAAIYGLGHRAGKEQKNFQLERQLDETIALLNAARAEGAAWREKYNLAASQIPKPGEVSDSAAQKLGQIRTFFSGRQTVWLKPPSLPIYPRPIGANGKPIVTVGNLKGGVGKTTVAAHLAAAFGRSGKKVLLVDLDFQGSLSSLMFRSARRPDLYDREGVGGAAQLIRHTADIPALRTNVVSLGDQVPNVHMVPAHYKLADLEEELLLKWVIGDEPEDIRFFLSAFFQRSGYEFDVAIIDTPPRLSTATVQALAASTHVVIPTQLERKSVEAVKNFLTSLELLREAAVNPYLDLIGVLPSVVDSPSMSGPVESVEKAELLKQIGPAQFLEQCPIPNRTAFKRPNLVYNQGSDEGAVAARQAIDKLAELVGQKIWQSNLQN